MSAATQEAPETVELLIIDELGFVPLSKTGAELLFELVSQRYERGATIITSNLPKAPYRRHALEPLAVASRRDVREDQW